MRSSWSRLPKQAEAFHAPRGSRHSAPRGLRRRDARAAAGLRVEVVASGLEVPWEIAFLPIAALVTERPGRIRLLEANGELREEPVATVDVSAQGEGGLLGLALDPEFGDNGLVYLYFTTAEG